MKKVLVAVKNMNVGGVEKSLLSLLNTIDCTEFEVDLLLLENSGGFMDKIPEWVNIIIFEKYAHLKDAVNDPPLHVIKNRLATFHLIEAARLFAGYSITKITGDMSHYYKAVFMECTPLLKHYDIAISYSSIINYLTWIVTKYVVADEYIGWIHFEIDKIGIIDKRFFLALHRPMSKIYIVSPSSLSIFTDMFPELKTKCEVRYNLIDEKELRQSSEEESETIGQDDSTTIITVGRLTVQKNQIIIPEIVAILHNKGYKVQWYLIGDGGEKQAIEEKCKIIGVDKCIHFLGRLTNPYPYLKQGDIYVQPSIYEGYCIALGEARVFGLPCVATSFSGAHEQLDGKENCYVVRCDVKDIANAIIKIINALNSE